MAINVQEATRLTARVSAKDPITERWSGVTNATNKSCVVYRPDRTTLVTGSNTQVTYLGLSEDGEEGIYGFTCKPDVPGIYTYRFSMQDASGNPVSEEGKFYVNG